MLDFSSCLHLTHPLVIDRLVSYMSVSSTLAKVWKQKHDIAIFE